MAEQIWFSVWNIINEKKIYSCVYVVQLAVKKLCGKKSLLFLFVRAFPSVFFGYYQRGDFKKMASSNAQKHQILKPTILYKTALHYGIQSEHLLLVF